MKIVTRKTEVEPIDGTPEKRLFWSIIADYDLATGLTELIDNAVDIWMSIKNRGPLSVELTLDAERQLVTIVDNAGGVRRDRDPSSENYGVYIYCNNRLIAKELRMREVGYFVGSEAGVPHPDASLCRAIVRLNGPAKLMPWNSSKTGINFGHTCFAQLRPTLIQLVAHFSSLSRRLKDDWDGRVLKHANGEVQEVPAEQVGAGKKLVLPPLPRVQKRHHEQLRARNREVIAAKPWTLGLVEAVAAVDIIARQRLDTRNRIALLLLDSNFEIALKEFIVHRTDLFDPKFYNDAKIAELFEKRHKAISTVISKTPIDAGLLERARHYYILRNKLIHERATVGITDTDVDNYREAIEQILTHLFDLQF